jgi:hypothetical protein
VCATGMLCPKTMPRLGPGPTAGFHHAIRRIWLSELWPRAADRRRPQRTDRRRLELSAIVAYLFAGIIIGPYGLAAFGTPESIIPVSELGVVMLLFLIGLELELGRLLAMRRAIFSLGAAQLTLTALTIGALGYVTGLVDWQPEAEEIRSHPPAAE